MLDMLDLFSLTKIISNISSLDKYQIGIQLNIVVFFVIFTNQPYPGLTLRFFSTPIPFNFSILLYDTHNSSNVSATAS